jgi:mono/diheme cytochrome c family protein
MNGIRCHGRYDRNAAMLLCVAFPLILVTRLTDASPLLSDVATQPPLSQVQTGQLRMGDLQCAACHGGREQNGFLEKSAPNLTDVGARIAPDFLRQFLASPSTTQPGTTMPHMLASYSDAKRDEIAEALTHFLVSQSNRKFQPQSIGKPDSNAGKELFHSVGCVACHAPREMIATEQADDEDDDDEQKNVSKKADTKSVGVQLGHLTSKYSLSSLSEFLFQPLQVRSSGRMPDMKLTTIESQAIASYLLGESSQVPEALSPNEPLVVLGRKYFQELNCAACHSLGDFLAAPVMGPLKNADFSRGCLSKTQGRGPRYAIDESSTQAIVAALKEPKQPDSDHVKIAKTMTAFNCTACHIRDGYGGVAADRNPYFRSTEKNFGDDGRIPPPLTLVGAKLQPVWLKKVLFDGESVRPYMAARMPQYGLPNLQHLPAMFGSVDAIEAVDLKVPNPESNNKAEKEREKKLRAGGRELLGDQGLNCVACHNFNGKPSQINKGIDLMTTYQRLQPAWFSNFLRNPGSYRPRIIMPYSWPDGIAAHKTILDGDTEMQIEAIWYYLSLGTSAADPSGILRKDTKLVVTDTTRTYRGRSSVAGFRGIAVGFPEKLSYSFNAETGSLTGIWQGEFIRVERGGQGSGGFNPAGKAIALAQDVSFLEMSDEKAPWPLRPVITKEAPVNPNPLYPKNLGYQFKEYFFDETSVPTFVYRSGTVEIADRSIAEDVSGGLVLKRTFHFNSPIHQTLWFRALTGEIETETGNAYRARTLRLTIPESTTLLRNLSEDPKLSELLLKLEIPKGQSSLEITYEPIEK